MIGEIPKLINPENMPHYFFKSISNISMNLSKHLNSDLIAICHVSAIRPCWIAGWITQQTDPLSQIWWSILGTCYRPALNRLRTVYAYWVINMDFLW